MAKRRARKKPPAETPVSPEKAPEPRKGRRKRSRGKRRNDKTGALHATNSLEENAEKALPANESPLPEHDPASRNEPPEDFTVGPGVELFDGSSPVNHELEILQKVLAHKEWAVPELSFEALPRHLFALALNVGKDKKAGTGDIKVGEQLRSSTLLVRLHELNLKKLLSMKPQELRVLNEQPTAFRAEDQRVAILAAVAAELERRESRG